MKDQFLASFLRLNRVLRRALVRTVCVGATVISGAFDSRIDVAPAQEDDYDALILEPIADGLNLPVGLTSPPGDEDRLFIIEQHERTTGRLWIFSKSETRILPKPFLEVNGVSDSYEEGLLGLAFHPEFASNGYFYIYYTTFDKEVNPVPPHRASRLMRYSVSKSNPDRADPRSAFTVLAFPQATPIHNGGCLAFGPDRYLYVAVGDGSAADRPSEAAQAFADDPSTHNYKEHLMGRILRIDVDSDEFPDDPKSNYAIPPDNPYADTGAAETWLYGLRNPWRISFDGETGDLWIGDVGSYMYEEINVFPAGSTGSRNFGWPVLEGVRETGYSNLEIGVSRPPFVAFGREVGACVTGGLVYRGESMPWLRGSYFYADFAMGWVRSFKLLDDMVQEERDWTDILELSLPLGSPTLANISGFGEDSQGELYLVDLGGQIYKVTQSPYNLWRSTWFSPEELEKGISTGSQADPDGDGFSNAQEFANSTNPLLDESERSAHIVDNESASEVDDTEVKSAEETAL